MAATQRLDLDQLTQLVATLSAITDGSFPTHVLSAVGRAYLLNTLCQHLIKAEATMAAALKSTQAPDSWLLEQWSLVVEEAWTAVAMDTDDGLEEGFDQLTNALLIIGFCLETLVERGQLVQVSGGG